MTYNGAEQAMIDVWVEDKLTSHAAFNSLGFGTLTDRVFNAWAPDGTQFPYIIFQAQSPPEVVRGVGDAEVMVSTIYVVKAVAQGSNFNTIAPVAGEIRTALVTPNGEAITGSIGTIFTCFYEKQVSMTQPVATQQFRHLGGEFTIQAQPA